VVVQWGQFFPGSTSLGKAAASEIAGSSRAGVAGCIRFSSGSQKVLGPLDAAEMLGIWDAESQRCPVESAAVSGAKLSGVRS
jgi:hypothetical protein